MTTPTLKRQYIADTTGNPVAVILPIEEFRLIEAVLRERLSLNDKLTEMEEAASDPLFIADLEDVMADFQAVDGEWWEFEE